MDATCQYIVSAADDGNVFVLSSQSTKEWSILFHTKTNGSANTLSVATDTRGVNVRVLVGVRCEKTTKDRLSDSLYYFEIKKSIVQVLDSHLSNPITKLMKEASFNVMQVSLKVPVKHPILGDHRAVFACDADNFRLLRLELPEEVNEETNKLVPKETFRGHSLELEGLTFSPHRKWIASWGKDGQVLLRNVGTLDEVLELSTNDFRQGGVRTVAFSFDSRLLFTSGFDGSMACFDWSYASGGVAKAEAAEKFANEILRNRGSESFTEEKKLLELTENICQAEASEQQDMEAEEASTWLDLAMEVSIKEEDKEYANEKLKIKEELKELRMTIQNMMTQNDEATEFEKLGHEEFDLDVEEQKKLLEIEEKKLTEVRLEAETHCLANRYLREVIKQQCWDDMEVKGRSLLPFDNGAEVHNYPMQARSRETLNELERVLIQRRIELKEEQDRQEALEDIKRGASGEEKVAEDEDADEDEKNALDGSLGAKYGGAQPLLYSQFSLTSREQKVKQIIMLQDCIHRIKETFNKNFDHLYSRKKNEVKKLTEINRRIRQIIDDVSLTDVESPPDYVWTEVEKPEIIFVVNDSEIKVERYLTPEQREKKLEQEKAEHDRRAREKADNWRERGLDMMMGGVLEIRREDELKKEIPIPRFASEKAEDTWSDEEKKIHEEYLRKCAELSEEREKFKKQLETELRKLQQQATDSKFNFDETLGELSMLKVKTEMAVNQEELKIMRLKVCLLTDEEFDYWDKEISHQIESMEALKNETEANYRVAAEKAVVLDGEHKLAKAQDADSEKSFRRELHGVPASFYEQLHKMFKARPKISKATASRSETPMFDSKSGNPFHDRPSTTRQRNVTKKVLSNQLKELDSECHMPDGLDPSVWTKFCRVRRTKVYHELKVKELLQESEETLLYSKKLLSEATGHQTRIDVLLDFVARLQEIRLRWQLNQEIQLVLKQGQVEINPGSFIPDYTGSVLIHKSVVEDLNSVIKQLGEAKVASMEEAMNFKKDIMHLEWEHKKTEMEMQDLRSLIRDINNFKVTREVQNYLNYDNYDTKKEEKIKQLEATLKKRELHTEKILKVKDGVIRKLQRKVQVKEDETLNMDRNLEEKNVAVNERRHIQEAGAANSSAEDMQRQRYRDIVQRRKLVDVAKTQAQEVAVLRAEVERLRMRTFPALVQVEH